VEHGPTVGVEEEFLLVDATGHLADCGPRLAARPDPGPGELQHELARCQVELATGVCRDATEVLGQLVDLRTRLRAGAAELGARLLPCATPVLDEPDPALTANRRYERMAEHFGAIAQTSSTCGQHVHVAIPDRASGVRVINHLRPWLPVLLALTANSPFHFGTDTGHASWRHVMLARWPSAGPPPWFGSLDQYEASVAALLRSGAMLDRAMLYWDVRLSEQQPTVEIRVADVAATPHEAALLAALVRAMVAVALDGPGRGGPLGAEPVPVPGEVLRAHLWRAAHDGLAGRCVHPLTGSPAPAVAVVRELADGLAPVLREHGDHDLVDDMLARADDGDGATRQRAVFARRGSLADVVQALAG
jgi:glutamate---cysteine ligase / carboxylate-amine ligase